MLMGSHFASVAQKSKLVSGEYIYYPPTTQSFDEAKHTALHRAKIQILADTFGTTMNMSSTTVISNSKENSGVNMLALGESSIKGEWLETIGEPEYLAYVTEDGIFVVKVKITGKVREITGSNAEFDIKILKNGTDNKFESSDFHEGDDMFVSFTSPADGYLTIYLYDGDDSVYCLLPYQQQRPCVIPTEGGKRYVFFSSEYASYGVPETLIDEYTLTCTKELEINRMYAIWSPDSYYKAVDSVEDKNIPRMLEFKEFQNWLSKLRTQNSKVTVKTIDITIKKQL